MRSFVDTCDLNLAINTDGLSASSKTNDALCFLWAGVRATYGFNRGKICYEIRVSTIGLSPFSLSLSSIPSFRLPK